MSNSAYAVLSRNSIYSEADVLFLRRSNGEWWLPGGKIESEEDTPSQAVNWMVSKLLTPFSWHPEGIGMWRLSPEAGGHAVHLFEGYVTEPSRVRVRDNSSGLSQELAYFDRHYIRHLLYEEGTIPWGQAKMAIYSLHDLYKRGRLANGEMLKDDLGKIKGVPWNRPVERQAQ